MAAVDRGVLRVGLIADRFTGLAVGPGGEAWFGSSVHNGTGDPAGALYRLDAATGQQTLWRSEDGWPFPGYSVSPKAVTPDGRVWMVYEGGVFPNPIRGLCWFDGTAVHIGDAWGGAAPSRTAVDKDGNAYVANRGFQNYGYPGWAYVFKVLNSGFIDRNGNGTADTSTDTSGNGRIEPSEMKPLTDTNTNGVIEASELKDERVAWAVRVPDGVDGQDEAGRLWDVLWMFRHGARLTQYEGPEFLFELYVRNDNRKAELVTLKAWCGPGDELEPVITIMLPGED